MKRPRPLFLLAAPALLLAAVGAHAQNADSPLRTWTDATGQFSVEAEFLRFENGKVHLRRKSGEEIAVPSGKLSRDDQQFVRELLARRRSNPQATPAVEQRTGSTAGDWPTWRGPNRDGICQETGLLEQWPSDGPPLVWQVEGLGTGYASVAVAAGTIYTMGRRSGTEYLIALDSADGSQRWSTAVGRSSREKGPNCTVTVDGNRVYGLSFEGDLVCADTQNGSIVWRKNFASDFGGRMMSGWGYSESPLIDGERLICTPGGSRAMMAALDKQSGRVIWTTPMPNGGSRGSDGAGYSSAVVSHAAGVKQYVQLVGRGVIGVAAADGRLLWRYEAVANGTANVPTPIVHGDFVFCSTGYNDGGSALLQLSGGPRGIQAREVYYLPASQTQNHHGGMIRVGDHIYMGHGHNNGFPLCLDMKTGRDVWRPGRGPGSGSAAILLADGHLYFRYDNGLMALIEATPSEYRLKSSFRLPSNRGSSWPHPVIADGRLYLRDQDVLLCYDVRAR